mgnify:CR=1 FL=1
MTQEQKQIQDNTLTIKDLKTVNWLFFTFIVGLFVMGITIHYESKNRLNEQKRLLIELTNKVNEDNIIK